MHERNVLYVEDNLGDYVLVERFLSERYPNVHLSQAINGVEALKTLESRKEPPARLPDLILLDINLPVMDGIETLERIRGDAQLKLIPVVMFTSSSRPEDISRSYERQASGYITKASSIQEYRETLDGIVKFWLESVCLPGQVRGG